MNKNVFALIIISLIAISFANNISVEYVPEDTNDLSLDNVFSLFLEFDPEEGDDCDPAVELCEDPGGGKNGLNG